ncbi:MAG TPA: hypothetical protein VNR00_14725 [Opitutus sp.]|nr:hypothetical protein [Opitutus sp.]
MINSTNPTDRTPHAEALAASAHAAPRPLKPRPDQLSTDSAAFLRSELQRQPEVRAEVVERARALASDPNYPSREVLKHVGAAILTSPDLSEDES